MHNGHEGDAPGGTTGVVLWDFLDRKIASYFEQSRRSRMREFETFCRYDFDT